MITRNFGSHNTNYAADKRRVFRDHSLFFAPAGSSYMILPRNRGVISPKTQDVTLLYAPVPKPGTSNPRTYGKREVLNWGYRTSIFF